MTCGRSLKRSLAHRRCSVKASRGYYPSALSEGYCHPLPPQAGFITRPCLQPRNPWLTLPRASWNLLKLLGLHPAPPLDNGGTRPSDTAGNPRSAHSLERDPPTIVSSISAGAGGGLRAGGQRASPLNQPLEGSLVTLTLWAPPETPRPWEDILFYTPS